MNDDVGFEYSFSGFSDYESCYHTTSTAWIVIGSIIFAGTIVSCIPQIILVVKNRSSFGLNAVAVAMNSLGQFLLVVNYIYLHSADFSGISQVGFIRPIVRFMSFGNIFALFICYFPVMFCVLVFFDRESRIVRPRNSISKERRMVVVTTIVLVTIYVTMSIVHLIISFVCGFASSVMMWIGKFYGTASALLVIIQYLPQMITTIRLKDSGSLSLVTLGIQAPGGLTNSLFLWLGQGDDWTTWLSLFMGACQQFILLSICVYFKIRRTIKDKSDKSVSSMSTPIMQNEIQKMTE